VEADVVIIGGGHNGLTCGAYLARAGAKKKPARKIARRRDLLDLFGDTAILERIVGDAGGELLTGRRSTALIHC